MLICEASNELQNRVTWMVVRGFDRAIRDVAVARSAMNADRVRSTCNAIRPFIRDDARIVVASAQPGPGCYIFSGEMIALENQMAEASNRALQGRKISAQTLVGRLVQPVAAICSFKEHLDPTITERVNYIRKRILTHGIEELRTWCTQDPNNVPFALQRPMMDIAKVVWQPGCDDEVIRQVLDLAKIREVQDA